MTRTRPALKRYDRGLNPYQLVAVSFISFILVGSILLMLPPSHQGAPHHWVDDLFIAASSVCVTGLVPIDPGTSYSLLGQGIILMLVQLGGLGYMTLFTVSIVLVGRQLSMRDRLNLQEVTEQPGLSGLVNFAKNIVLFTLLMETLGACLLSFVTVPEFGWRRGLYFAVFYSISSFNNAGITLLPEGAAHWQGNEYALLVIAALVISGGLGYTVNNELVRRFVFRMKPRVRWNVLLRVVLVSTAILLVGATSVIWLAERTNPATLGPMPLHTQWVNAFFMAAQPRSGGFNSIDVAAQTTPTVLMMIVLMFVGGAPGGTAGGIKITTVAVIMAAIYSVAVGADDVKMPGLRRRIGTKTVLRAFTVLALSLFFVVLATAAVASIERMDFLKVAFEVTSAFSTVGLSMGITPHLSDASKLILICSMVIGRIGMIALILSIFKHRRRTKVRYPEEPLLVG